MFEDVEEGHLDGEEPVVFRYNREERIKHAPQIVRDYYDGKMNPVRGIKVLWVNKSNRFILLSLVLFVTFAWIYSGVNNTRGYAKVGNVLFQLQSFSYGDEVYVNLKITSKNKNEQNDLEKTKPVKIDAEFFFINNDNQVIQKEYKSLVYKNGEEYLRTKYTDYDIIRVDVMLNVDGEEKELSSNVKR